MSPNERSRFLDLAVAVTVCPAATFEAGVKVKEALPEASVVTTF